MKCVHCGKELTTFKVVDENDNPVCDDCFYKYYEQCNICNRAIPKGNGMCQSCSEQIFKKIMNQYSTKVTNIYGNKSDNIKCLNNRYFGLEMEYNNFNPSVARVLFKDQYNNKLIYNKSDASISRGVEIVTIPLVKSKVLKLIDDMDLSRIKPSNTNVNVTDGAGLHIHVSKNTITPIAIHRLSLLFNSSWALPYKNYIYYIVGRSDAFKNYRGDDNYYRVGTTTPLKSMKRERVSSHGVALNLSNNHTVEFRLFKATTNPEQLKSYIEFVELAIQFAETQPIKMITIPNFITYLYLNTTNKWLKHRLDKIHSDEPDLFEVKEKQFTYDYYISKFIGDDSEIYKTISKMNEKVSQLFIDWDIEKIDRCTIDRWIEKSSIYGVENNKLLDSLLSELKKRVVRKILAK